MTSRGGDRAYEAPLRFALLTADGTLERWLADAITRATSDGLARCVAVITPSVPLSLANRATRMADVIRDSRSWAYYLLRRASLRTELSTPVPATDVATGGRAIVVDVEQRGAVMRVTAEGVQVLAELEVDFLLLGEFGILKGAVLEAAPLGVWSFHHGDPRSYRGRPSCFWELHDGCPVVSAGIQRLNETLDGGHFMRLVTVSTKPSFGKTMTSLYQASTTLFASTCNEVLQVGGLPEPVELPTPLPALRRRPSNRAVVVTMASVAKRSLARMWRGAFVRRDWEIGVVRKEGRTPWESIAGSLDKVTWVRPSKSNVFWADPCVVDVSGDEVTLFAEEFDYREGYGKIVLLKVHNGDLVERIIVLDDEHHHAFPHVARTPGGWLATTDTCCERGSLYEFTVLGESWKVAQPAAMPKDLSDPVLVRKPERWLAVGTARCIDSFSWCAAYEAEEPAGPWREVRPFPLFVDVTCARGGGTLDTERHVRVSQDCSGTYGAANTITILDERFWLGQPRLARGPAGETDGAAQPVTIKGTHTVSWASGDWVMADRCVLRFDLFAWRHRLVERRRRRRCSG